MNPLTLWQALKAGNELKDPAKWKNRQNTANALTAVLSVLVVILRLMGIDLYLTDEQIILIAGAAATILSVANSILTTATTKKIGVLGRRAE